MSYKTRLANIRAFVFDVDGVFTDGSILLQPDGTMSRTMSVLDGYAVVKAVKEGYTIGIITGGNEAAVKHRFTYLGVTDYYPKSPDKLVDYQSFKQKHQLSDQEILVMGDDIPDLVMLREAGISSCPADAVPEVLQSVDYISPVKGGRGAVRDVIEQVLKVQGKWLEDKTQSV